MRRSLLLGIILVLGAPVSAAPPRLVGHRGLINHAPENTLAAFGACLDLRVGFELDVRRSKDGVLVCVHDGTLTRTTGHKGKVGDLPLAELKKLDAGTRFDPAFTGERIPTLDEVFALVKARAHADTLIAVDIKIDDTRVEGDIVKLAKKHGVLSKIICIGTTIDSAAVRKRLKAADKATPTAVLAQTAKDLDAALKTRDADWAYVRFVPTAAQVQQTHKAGKKVFLAGVTVASKQPANWRKARDAGVDALLTDHPLTCRQVWKQPAKD